MLVDAYDVNKDLRLGIGHPLRLSVAGFKGGALINMELASGL